jgi:hypothetical protein
VLTGGPDEDSIFEDLRANVKINAVHQSHRGAPVKFTLTGDAGPVTPSPGSTPWSSRRCGSSTRPNGNGGAGPRKVAVRVRSTPLGKVKSLEVSW